MDLFTLVVNLEKEPKAYTEEFRKQIHSFTNMCRLPKQPTKALRQTLDLLIKFSFVDRAAVSEAIVESVAYLKSYKLKKIVLSALLSLVYKRLIPPSTCIRAILEHSSDPAYFINKVKTFIDRDSAGVVRQYYEIGNEKQKAFCYYFLLVLFSKFKISLQEEICSGLFGEGKIKKLSFGYFLEHMAEDLGKPMDLLDEKSKPFGRRLFDEIVNTKEEREIKVMKMRVYVLFKNRFGLKPSIVPLALAMIDPSKEDVKDLMNIVVDSVSEKELDGVLKNISTDFCSPFKEEDLICYGLNLMRFIYCKFDKEVENGSEERNDVDSSEEYSEERNVEDSSEEYSEEMNVEDSEEMDSEDLTDNNSGDLTHNNTEDKSIPLFLKETILSYVECFKDSKVKSVSYSYRAVSNVLKKKKNTGREINFILRKLTKEERLEAHRKNKETNKIERELYKAEKKEMSKKKSKRKFKLSKKRLKINAGKRLKTSSGRRM